MSMYSFEVALGVDEYGSDIKQTFVIEAASFSEARHKLEELVSEARNTRIPP